MWKEYDGENGTSLYAQSRCKVEGRPSEGCRDGVKGASSIPEGKRSVWDKMSWSDVVYWGRRCGNTSVVEELACVK